MKKLLLVILLFPWLAAIGQATYNPSYTPLFTVASKPYAISQAAPVDGRSYKADSVNFLWRPYHGTSEVLSYLNLSKYRTGQFPIEVNVGGTLNSNGTFTGGYIYEYWFRSGTADTCLVLKSYWPTNTSGFLQAANNLSDVQSTSTSRSNLGLGAMATQGTTASSTDLMGTWPGSLVVESIQGHNLAYLLNYNNLTNKPTIPAQFNPIAGTNMSLNGTYPNITFNSAAPIIYDTVGTITDLINYSRNPLANTILVTDSVRGGTFYYQTIPANLDSGVVFPATGKLTGFWIREFDRSKGANPMWFGAINDSSVDFGAIVNTMAFHGYKNVTIPAGNFYLKTTINPIAGSPIHINGYGPFNTFLFVIRNVIGIVLPYSGSATTERASIQSLSLNSDTVSTQNGIEVNTNYTYIGHCSINGFGFAQIRIDGTTGNADFGLVEDVTLYNGGRFGIYQSGGSDVNKWTFLQVDDEGGQVGFRLDGASNSVINCTSQAADTSFWDNGLSNTYIAPYSEGGGSINPPVFLVTSSDGVIVPSHSFGFLYPTFVPLTEKNGWSFADPFYNYHYNLIDFDSALRANTTYYMDNGLVNPQAFELVENKKFGAPVTLMATDSAYDNITFGKDVLPASSTLNLGRADGSHDWNNIIGLHHTAQNYDFFSGATMLNGNGSPSGVVTAPPGSLYFQNDGVVGKTLWLKESFPSSSTGWAPFSAPFQRLGSISQFPAGQGNIIALADSADLVGINTTNPKYNLDDRGIAFVSLLKLAPNITPAVMPASDSILLYQASDSSVRKAPYPSIGTLVPHKVWTATDGGTISLQDNTYNIINQSGAYTSQTLNMPGSPTDGDVVEIKFTNNVVTLTFSGGTVINAPSGCGAGTNPFTAYLKLVYDSATTSWY